jgi:hypothetical protein
VQRATERDADLAAKTVFTMVYDVAAGADGRPSDVPSC